ncbi:hypothetical protein BCR39DRAFT_522258 [Naematelia encephala]|uniref:Uncharacterized protein n=1 Tax=Naematelia encephala TaxID=71784 RepID=A0A1Y2BDH6_9TREE|nr:hypothetical protein BCR39DRAFT_522258 [Naematelia encephala]
MPTPIHSFSEDETDIVKISPPSSTTMIEDEKKPSIKQEKVDVQAMVDDTVKRVREQSDRFQAAAIPYADATRSLAENKPVLFTFLAIFTFLSIIPIGIFAAFVLSATAFIVGSALVIALLSVLGTVLFASTLLLPILFVTTLISLSILTFLLALFLAHRLYLHIQLASTDTETETVPAKGYDKLSRGVRGWLDETGARVNDGLEGVGWKGSKSGPKWELAQTQAQAQGENDVTPRPPRVLDGTY